ncbi:MAG: hypothetical protein O2948_14955 [Proteobacteria bacterium]|nr:hypothetical protein [Pseudomonadota bacterium]MDA0926829.1 hypothetical protein [Pseudomonadota bacterium]
MPLSRIINLLLRSLLALLISSPFIFLLLALQSERLVPANAVLSAAELNEVEQLLLESAPESTLAPSRRQLQLSSRELNLLQRYGFQVMGLLPGWSGRLELQQDEVNALLSIQMNVGPLPIYLNMQGSFTNEDDGIHLRELRLGNLQLPDPIMDFAVSRIQNNLLTADVGFDDFQALMDNVDAIELAPEQVSLTMLWEPQLMDRLAYRAQQIFVPLEDRERILDYYRVTKDIVSTIPRDLRAVSLNTFLVAMFKEAQDRSRISGDPVAENRAALQALAVYVNNEDIAQLVGQELAAGVEAASFIEVRLQRRQDLAQHLVSIAAITASAGAGFAQLLSNTKEAYDARYRSGFSFSDMTANTVGVLLASHATRDPASAADMQARIIDMESESDFMPEVGSNRDGISEADFNVIYQDRNSYEYAARIEQIRDLIEERPLFQGLEPIPVLR